MYFSGKVTHSVLSYLMQSGADLDEIYNLTDLSANFLRDPSYWLAADQVEKFLSEIQNTYAPSFSVGDLCETAGHQGYALCSWGVLDSVLKMMTSPQDIFTQPQRFISYFISPAPPVGHLKLDLESVYFELPISYEEYPFFGSYLKAALESLPQFMQKPMAHVEWKKNKIKVHWEDRQQKLIKDGDKQLKPEFVQNLLSTIEKTERELEKKNRELQERESEVRKLRSQWNQPFQNHMKVGAELEKARRFTSAKYL